MTGIYERDYQGVAQGQYSTIVRESWQQITFQAGVLVPIGQAAAIATSSGLVAAIFAGIICHIYTLPFRYVLITGMLVDSIIFAWQSAASIAWTRGAYLAKERYLTERRQGAQADKTTVTVELIDRQANSGYGQTLYDEIGASPEQLALVVRADRLSKRGLMDVGLSDAHAMRLLAQLLALRYIVRQADNEPAEWTSKGQALRRAFAGGGGGGGAVVDVTTTSKTQ